MKWLTIAVIVVVLVVATVAAITAIEMHRKQIETYYQGVYSFCMVFNALMVDAGSDKLMDCDGVVFGAYEAEWHERDALGFEWPPSPVAD